MKNARYQDALWVKGNVEAGVRMLWAMLCRATLRLTLHADVS